MSYRKPGCPVGIDRRAWLAASLGATAAVAVNRRASAEPVDPELEKSLRRFCIDRPLVTPGEEEAAAPNAPVVAAILEEKGKGNVEELSAPSAPGSSAARAPSPSPSQMAPRAPNQSRASAPAKAAYLSRWKNGSELRVCFLTGGSYTDRLAREVLDVAREWTKYANLTFTRSNSLSAEVRCGFGSDGNWSLVGTSSLRENVGQKSMNLQINNMAEPYSRYVVLHEFGHALGCIHEHSQPNRPFTFRPEVYTYFARLGLNRAAVDFNILKRYNQNELIRFSEFDPKSIMLYQIPKEATNEGVGTVQTYDLSKTDIQFVKMLYPNPRATPEEIDRRPSTSESRIDAGPQTLPVNGTRVSGAITSPGGEATFEFTIPADRSDRFHTVATEGTTQVSIRLYGPDDASREFTLATGDQRGTPDHINEVLIARLKGGKYVAKVRHLSPEGGGKFVILASEGQQDILLGMR